MRSIPTFRTSATANLAGQAWAALMGIAFLPLYLKLLGAEAFALVGVFAILQAWVSLLDLGLTPTLTREIARVGVCTESRQKLRNLLRSFELLCGGMMVGVVALLWWGADYFVTRWLRVESLPTWLVIASLQAIALTVATRFFEQIYRGALQGAHDQVWLNKASALLATCRWGGAYLVIAFWKASILAFFIWQGAIALLTIGTLASRLYRILPRGTSTGKFDRLALLSVSRFASGMFVSSLLSFLLTQVDKLAISKLLPISEFGYYALAASLSGGLMQLVTPLNTAVFPRLAAETASENTRALEAVYRDACAWMALVVVPVALVLSAIPELVLHAWSGDRSLATRVSPLLSILAIGNLANALVNIPYMLQLAYGWTALSIRINLVAVVAFVPLVLWAVPRFGGQGAALVWLTLNVGYLILGPTLTHRRLLPNLKSAWYWEAVVVPLFAGGITAFVARLISPVDPSRLQAMFYVVGAVLAVLLAVAGSSPQVRSALLKRLHSERTVQ